MKRRDFLTRSLALTGLYLPGVSRGQTVPCPPVLATGGNPPICGNGEAAEVDWQDRISQSAVVWYHDFRNQSEVDQFRWTGTYGGGNDPTGAGQLSIDGTLTSMYRQTADGVTGGACLELLRPAGTSENAASWWRQFNPLSGADNGRGVDDPGASGTIPLASYEPTDRGSETATWVGSQRPGWYGNSDYHTGSKFDGSDFFLQMRVKMDPRRIAPGNIQVDVGKLTYLTTTERSLTDQEIVTYSNGSYAGVATNFHRMYTAGSPTLESQDSLGRPGQQVGSELADYDAGIYCNVGTQRENCWAYSGGWDTLLYHVTPGHDGIQDTRIEVWAANQGDVAYTKIWDVIYDTGFYTSNTGWNALIASTYQNGGNCPVEFWHRYDQIIFSKEFIPCPQI